MFREIVKSLVFVFFLILLAACGPSAEEIAALTAAAAPTQTPEPTPVPYDLTILVTDADGSPISGAALFLDGDTFTTDRDGQVSFSDLSGSSASLSAAAPGYFPLEQTASLERGDNQLTLALDLDPNGLLPGSACGPGETLLYLDDFQDGIAQGWDVIETLAPGWSVEPNPDSPNDMVIAARQGAPLSWLNGGEMPLDNSVWRSWFNFTGQGGIHFNFRWMTDEGDTRYIASLSNGHASLDRLQNDSHVGLENFAVPKFGQWHFLEMSYYEGTVEVWVDGQQMAVYEDPNPWQGGSVSLEPGPEGGDSVFYFDDISVCALNAPFATLPRPQTGYNLSLIVSDAEGNPLTSTASVPELGGWSDAQQTTDVSGGASWTDLPAETVTVQVAAPGYFAVEQALTLEKGDNQQSVVLEADPKGLTAAQACLPTENLLYIEDFQGGDAPGWPEISFAAGGWAIGPAADDPDNLIATASTALPAHSMLQDQIFDQAVWRLRFMIEGRNEVSFNWRQALEPYVENDQEINDSRYQIPIGTNQSMHMRRLQQPVVNVGLANGFFFPKQNTWHLLEISYYDDLVQVWMDGKRALQYQETNPLPPGGIALEWWNDQEGVFAYFDNISVCELTAPFESITTLEPGG